MKKTLIIFSHSYFENSKVNKALLESIKDEKSVEVRNLDELYGSDTKNIDVKTEQLALEQADKIIFQFPLFWYSTPAMLKAYMDLVLTYGWAHGSKTKALKDKEFAMILSAGANKENFSSRNNTELETILSPLTLSMKFCQLQIKDNFEIFSASSLNQDELNEYIKNYKEFLLA